MSRVVIGLTGGIGSGKSTAAAMLAELGAVIVDCDQLGRDVAASTGAAFEPLVDRFGEDIVGEDGELNRAKLGSIVFNDADELAALNAITHPAIDAEIERAIAEADDDAVVVLDMAVLVESDLGRGIYEEVLVIETPTEQRLDRLVNQRGLDPEDARSRINSQASDAQRRAVADAVLLNDGDQEQLAQRVRAWWASRFG